MNLKLFHFKMFLAGICLIISCIAPLSLNSANLISYSTQSQTDLLLDKIYAVHATRTLPDSEYLRAGFAPNNNTPIQKILPQVRKTLHFSLGELVRPVEGFMNWEDCPYALVTPLRGLLPQLLNVNCYDTFILGDLKLGPDTYLILPIEVAAETESQATIITYDPQCKTLREAVDEFIFLKGGWHIEMNSDDIEDELHEAFMDGYNINSSVFFEPLKEGRPWLAVGLRFDPLDGEHYRLSHVELNILSVIMQMFSQEDIDLAYLESAKLENSILVVNDHFDKWSQSLTGFNWCTESQRAHQQIESEIKNCLNLINEELRIREVYGKTLISAPVDFLLECAALLNQPEALQLFIDQNTEQLKDYPMQIRDSDTNYLSLKDL
jgi:hypothetical protein